MDQGLKILLRSYTLTTREDSENALKEVVQHIALLGLWRSRFFEHAAFYGGTSLRILYGSGRFSEDMDFSLLKKDNSFGLKPYLKSIRTELESFGFDYAIETRHKQNPSNIESAFIKGNTVTNLLTIEVHSKIVRKFHRDQKIKIKFEVDTDPPPKAAYEVKNVLVPIPFQVKVFTRPDLFAGKMHAVLCRQWQSRVKGRDFYDLIWFLGQKVPCHLDHLKERMIQTDHWRRKDSMDRGILIELLNKKFGEIDFEMLRADVRPFIKDLHELDLWSQAFFGDIILQLETC
jgi:predicted nucleotidyltransferase component of viral defense system